jgi:hypothetical protein
MASVHLWDGTQLEAVDQNGRKQGSDTSVEALDGFLGESGFVVEERLGSRQREPFRDESEEVVSAARAGNADDRAATRRSRQRSVARIRGRPSL